MRYRRIPSTVEAVQWTGDNRDEMREFAGEFFRFIPHEDRENPELTAEVHDILHKCWVPLRTRDWVVRGFMEEFWPVHQDVFAVTYERDPEDEHAA